MSFSYGLRFGPLDGAGINNNFHRGPVIDMLSPNGWRHSLSIANRLEMRPWQGVRLNWPNWKLPFDHLLRLEERFEWNTSTWELDASLRLRYRLRVSYRWAALLREDRHWKAHGSAEIFGRLAGQDGQFQEQVRLALGIERSFPRKARLRIEIVWQKVDELIGGPVNDIYIRVRVFHGWD